MCLAKCFKLQRELELCRTIEEEREWVPKSVPRYRVCGLWGVVASVGGCVQCERGSL